MPAAHWSRKELDKATTAEVAALARAALQSLARRPDPEAFTQLLALAQANGECLGVSARTLAEQGSWSGVADMAGTTKQAAWSRWSQP
jgi:hypothetical protein